MLILEKITQGSAGGYAEYLEGKAASVRAGGVLRLAAGSDRGVDAGQAGLVGRTRRRTPSSESLGTTNPARW